MINPSLHCIKGFASKYLSIFDQIDPTGVDYISSKSGEKIQNFCIQDFTSTCIQM